MNDAEFDALKERLEALVEYWRSRMGLKWWSIKCRYVRAEFEVDGEQSPQTGASCKADWRYLLATLSFNMVCLNDLEPEDLEYIVVHELCHILVNETRDLVGVDKVRGQREDDPAHEERVVTQLAWAFIWTRDRTRDEVMESISREDS